ncbi:efflux RND transporter periplasmic adaptor subunit [Shimazuella sp. AN120528]|uniref:efflux RND transporter periplasmic adaptor subunit n=1 Tax=Shimazuella soli TaxID=1892854 RepID=UPI001F0DB831|nr:HlyD family efflux transporter periplasmic adaptor subunit [Shimazuella soli]MCH5585366.1 efflux RND transporter periplasmic adaptor subunit [Shimazuella soli]
MKQWLATFVVIIVVLGIAVFGYQYVTDAQTYVSTDNATLEADTYSIDAEQTGVLTDWKIKEGDKVKTGDIVGKIQNKSLTSKVNATVVKTSVYANQNVFQGQTLAKMANLNETYVLAYIDEDQISKVKNGKDVKVTIESLSSEPYDGKVIQVGSGAGGVYESSPTTSSSRSEKEVQRVPVKISVNNLPIDRLTLGVHAEVKIER